MMYSAYLVLACALAKSGLATYHLKDDYSGANFFNMFDFNTVSLHRSLTYMKLNLITSLMTRLMDTSTMSTKALPPLKAFSVSMGGKCHSVSITRTLPQEEAATVFASQAKLNILMPWWSLIWPICPAVYAVHGPPSG